MIDLKILTESGYSELEAKILKERLSHVDYMFLSGIENWASTGEESDFDISGVRLSEIKNKFGMTYPAAILTMDWVLREPEKAIECINKGIK